MSLIYDLPIDAYHARPEISKSGLDDMDPPARYYALHLDPNRPPRVQTPAQRVGHLAHCAILEPEEFAKRYAVGPDVIRSTKVWKEFEQSLAPGVEPVKPDEYESAWRQRESVLMLPGMKEILAQGKAEVSAFWEDPYTGVQCRCRPDFAADCGVLLDVKTTGRASPEFFRMQAAKLHYDVQDAFYSEGYGIASGAPIERFLFLTVEATYPYLASVIELDVDSKQSGIALMRSKLGIYAGCLRSNDWPGYGSQIRTVRLPQWAQTITTQEEYLSWEIS